MFLTSEDIHIIEGLKSICEAELVVDHWEGVSQLNFVRRCARTEGRTIAQQVTYFIDNPGFNLLSTAAIY